MKIPEHIRQKYASQPGEFRSAVDISDLLALLPRPHEAITADFEYFVDNQESLSESYPDEWLAIVDKAVIAHHRDPVELHRDLRKRGLNKLAPVVEFAEKTPRNLSL